MFSESVDDKVTLESAKLAHQAGRLAEAISQYRRFLQSNPQNANAWYFLGMAEMQAKQEVYLAEQKKKKEEYETEKAKRAAFYQANLQNELNSNFNSLTNRVKTERLFRINQFGIYNSDLRCRLGG